MDEEDDSTALSKLFKSYLRGASFLADHSVHSYPAKRRHSNCRRVIEKNREAKGVKSSHLQSSAKGDLVWAKSSHFTWRPGQVKSFRGPLISISFFGCNKTRWFKSSEILRFEESYPRMVRMVAVKLSYEIDLALDEMARSIAMGLKCCCKVSAADEDRSLAVKRGFNPQEILCFLLDKAVIPQVFEGEIATVVRISAALNAFRHGVVVCNTSEVDEGFCAKDALEFVLDMAVNQCVDDKAVAQLHAFRRFASVKPAWFYQIDWEFEDDRLESHKIEVDLELLDCPSEDKLYHERTREPEVGVSIKPQEEYERLDVNYKQEVREMCVINMVDFSMFDTDNNYECLIYDQHQIDIDWGQPAGSILPSSTEESTSIMSKIDANETATNVVCSPHNGPNHILQVGEEVTYNRLIVPNLENATVGGNTTMPAHSDKYNNSVEAKPSPENLSLRTVPLYRGQLHSLPINKCSIFSPIKALNLSIKPQSRPDNAAQWIDFIPEMAPFAETALQISAKKRKLYEPPTFKNYKSTQTSPSSATLSEKGYNVNVISKLNHPGHSRNQRQNRHLESKCKAFYISPLTRNGPSSANNRLKSLDGNNHRNSSVLLNMKFPKDHTLPTKEQLEKKFSVFGALDHARTKVFFYTGVGQVVFLHQADAAVAYKYLTRKKMFGQANVRFWFYEYENCRKVSSTVSGAVHSLNVKPCLKMSCTPELIDDRKNCRVRFTV